MLEEVYYNFSFAGGKCKGRRQVERGKNCEELAMRLYI
jgi:hypothetical protein